MTDETAKAILALPDDGKFVHREMIWQGDWTNTEIATYAELKRMANLWLHRKDIYDALAGQFYPNADHRKQIHALCERYIEALGAK